MKIDVNLNVRMKSAGARAVLTSPKVRADLERRAENVAAAADTGAGQDGAHFVDSQDGPNRARAAVVTRTNTAKEAEATDRNLTRAFDEARR